MVRADRPAKKLHLSLVRRLASLHIIASKARTDQILPGILTASALRNNMIDRKCHTRRSAVLALVAIATKNILARQDHLLEWHADERR